MVFIIVLANTDIRNATICAELATGGISTAQQVPKNDCPIPVNQTKLNPALKSFLFLHRPSSSLLVGEYLPELILTSLNFVLQKFRIAPQPLPSPHPPRPPHTTPKPAETDL